MCNKTKGEGILVRAPRLASRDPRRADVLAQCQFTHPSVEGVTTSKERLDALLLQAFRDQLVSSMIKCVCINFSGDQVAPTPDY